MAPKKGTDALQFDLGLVGDEEDESASSAPVPPPREQEAVAATQVDRRRLGLQLAREALESGSGASGPLGRDLVPVADEATEPGSASDVALSVAGFYDRVKRALYGEFPGEIWVTGEIRKVTSSKGHRFVELADHLPPDDTGGAGKAPATLEVVCWSRDWPRIEARLDSVGLELTPGLVVRVRGRVSVWDAGARLRLRLSDIDVEALVGGIAAARRALLTTLAAEGVIDANRRLRLFPVPLRIGLVTSAGSEAYRDFTGQLERSGLNFSVRLERSLVQGTEAPRLLAAALSRLGRKDVDLIVLVRGGGAKGDLAAFDHEAVARAIVASPIPVWTGIGHTGDRSVADEVAHRALVTPTECGKAVVEVVESYLAGIANRATRLVAFGERSIDSANHELARAASDLERSARHRLDLAASSLAQAGSGLRGGANTALERCAATLGRRAQQLGSLPLHRLETAASSVVRCRVVLDAFNPRRQLERGWSLTRTADGRIVRSVEGMQAGTELVTSVADGSIRSHVSSAAPLPVRGENDGA